MVAPSDSNTNNVQDQTFPFMLLHPELRQMIYREVLSNRGIVLREEYRQHICTFHWEFYLEDSHTKDEDAIALLQTSKQIHDEAKPLLLKYTPSRLTLSKDLRRYPAYLYDDKLIAIALPFQHITSLNINVKCLGNSLEGQKLCPGPENGLSYFQISNYLSISGTDRGPPPDPKREPNLKWIFHLSQFFTCLPALREIHIYDVLKYHLSQPLNPCSCPIAGTDVCTCGKCQCICIAYPPLPDSPDISITETRDILHKALLFRFRAALPPPGYATYRRWSDYHAILEPLVHGTHVFLHEEIMITVVEAGKSIHKSLWRATYHLSPPEDAKAPADLPAKAAETPRQRRLRVEMGKAEKARLREQEGLDPVTPFDVHRFLADNLDFMNNDDNDPRVRKIPEALDERPLVEFEAGLEIELVDEAAFDTVLEDTSLESRRQEMEVKYGKFWPWD